MLTKLEIIANGQHSLTLPAEDLPITLLRNDFDLLTNNIAQMRPLAVTDTFEVPLRENRRIFEELKGQAITVDIKYNDIVLITGRMIEYSVDEQQEKVLITVTSSFKDVVDFMGNSILYLDVIDLSRWNYIVPETFDKSQSNELLKFGRYNPMDSDTGRIEYTPQNVADYCKPSINKLAFFKEVFRLAGWTANFDNWTATQKAECLLPTVPYTCSSWGFDLKGSYTIPASGSLKIPIVESKVMWNIVSDILGTPTAGAEIVGGNSIQVRQPNRLMSFKMKAQYSTTETFSIAIMDGTREMSWMQSLGDDTINYVSDNTNLQDGLDPLSLVLSNPNPYEITIDFTRFDFYNLFSIYETNQDDYLPPVGYMFPVADNFPKITVLEMYREFLARYQMAQKTADDIQEARYYFINDIFEQTFERVDTKPYQFWYGYTTLSDKITGLARINAIRYKGDLKRQCFFKVDIPSLPASAVYFESIFAHAEMERDWGAVQMPALQYKVKTVDNISYEYLEWKDITPMSAVYDETTGAMTFEDIQMTKIVAKYWNNIMTYLSGYDGYNPVVFKLKLRLFYYEYKDRFSQDKLFYYDTNSLLLGGTYDAINQIFEGTFLSVR